MEEKEKALQDFQEVLGNSLERARNESQFNYDKYVLPLATRQYRIQTNAYETETVFERCLQQLAEKSGKTLWGLDLEVFKNVIFTATIFWKWAKGHYREDRRQVLVHFMDHENLLVQLIARFESLPDETWRKLLWYENIDFLSMESCLRRVTIEQQEAIYEAYDALNNAEGARIPKVYYASFTDRLKIRLQMITPETIKSGAYGMSERYNTKPAWIEEFLGVDFGFSLYSKGVNDDTPKEDAGFMKFLSLKNHVNDFSVNQEFGKYWFMYRTARSNWAWRWNKTVTLSSHICPGFWATWLIHFLLWIASPVLFASTVVHYVHHSVHIHNIYWNFHIIPMILTFYPGPYLITCGFFYSLWMFLKNTKGKLAPWVQSFFEKISDWMEKHPEQVAMMKKVGEKMLIVLVGGVVVGFFGFIIWGFYQFFANVLEAGVIVSVLTAPMPLVALVTLILSKSDNSYEYEKPIKGLKIYLWPAFALLAGDLFIKYGLLWTLWFLFRLTMNIADWVVDAWSWILNFMDIAGVFFAGMVLSVGLIGFSFWFLQWFWRDETRFAKYAKNVRYLTGAIAIALLILIIKGVWQYGFDPMDQYNQVAFFSTFSALMMCSFVWAGTSTLNENTIVYRNGATELEKVFTQRLGYEKRIITQDDMMANPWLMSLIGSTKHAALMDIAEGMGDLFDRYFKVVSRNYLGEPEEMKRRFVKKFLPRLTEKNMPHFKEVCSQIDLLVKSAIKQKFPVNATFLMRVFELMFVENYNMDNALAKIFEARAQREREAEAKKALKRDRFLFWSTPIRVPSVWLYATILTPIGQFIAKWWNKFITFISQAKQLWVLFNEMCPYVHKSEQIQ
jgi:hypothetical protein